MPSITLSSVPFSPATAFVGVCLPHGGNDTWELCAIAFDAGVVKILYTADFTSSTAYDDGEEIALHIRRAIGAVRASNVVFLVECAPGPNCYFVKFILENMPDCEDRHLLFEFLGVARDITTEFMEQSRANIRQLYLADRIVGAPSFVCYPDTVSAADRIAALSDQTANHIAPGGRPTHSLLALTIRSAELLRERMDKLV